jgi:hypothetical protein
MIFETRDGESGLDLCRSQRIDCVGLLLDLPSMAVVALTDRTTRGVHEIAIQNGAYACFIRQFTSGEDLERAILHAMAFVGPMPREDRYQAFRFNGS